MAIDATGKEIIIGQKYGYSKQSNGITNVIIGTACKINDQKVTLENIQEKTYLYIDVNNEKISYPKNKRSIFSLQIFHIND